MERNKKKTLQLLLALLLVCAIRTQDCPKDQHDSLTCYNDYNRNITCVWNSTDVSDLTGNVCEIHAKNKKSWDRKYKASCKLEPFDVSRPALKKCSLIFYKNGIFKSDQDPLSINLSCNPGNQVLKMNYMPSCHIKLYPPEAPNINFTTVSWLPQVAHYGRLSSFTTQMQWRQKDQSWSVERTVNRTCKWECEAELDPDLLIEGEEYEARIRVKSYKYVSVWSDWSPTASWVSLIGKPKPPQSGDLRMIVAVGMTVAVVICLLLAFVYFKKDKTAWVYVVKKVKGKPIPNPKDSKYIQNLLSPHFIGKSFSSFLEPENFSTVKVISSVDAIAPCRPDMALLEKIKKESSCDSANSSFSNPSYSHLDPLPPITSLTAGNLEPCEADSPYGPVGGQVEGNTTGQDKKIDEEEIMQLLIKGSTNTEQIQVISDYNRVEKLTLTQAERVRLQSLDSGVSSGEEISQESLEADSMTDSHDEEPQGKEEREGDNGNDEGFQKFFGNIRSAGIFSKGSIQVCSGYEQVQKLQADSHELLSLDSGVTSGGEEQLSQDESLEDIDKSTESTRFPFPPLSCASPCSLPFSTSLPLRFSGPGFNPAQPPLPCHLLERIPLMSISESVEPSGDGYMSVTEKQS